MYAITHCCIILYIIVCQLHMYTCMSVHVRTYTQFILFQDCVSISTSDQDTAPGLKGHCYDNHRRSLVYRGFLPSRVTRHCHGERKEGREEEEERDCVASATVCLEDRSSSVWRYIHVYTYTSCHGKSCA